MPAQDIISGSDSKALAAAQRRELFALVNGFRRSNRALILESKKHIKESRELMLRIGYVDLRARTNPVESP